MPINVSTVRTAYLYPELLPDAQNINGAFGLELPVLDLRRFIPKVLQLSEINVEQNVNIAIRVFNNIEKYFINTGALRDRVVEPYNIIGTELLRFAIFGNIPVVNYRVNYNLWVYEPTTAHKLKLGIPLSAEDEEILQNTDIKDNVDKGLLPLPIDYLIDREYQLIDGRRTFTFSDFSTLFETVLQSFPVNIGEIAVLERISAAPNVLLDNVRIRIDRDDDSDYIELNTYPFQLNVPINCFIPALREIKIKIISDGIAFTQIQWTIARYKLSDILKIRFGLVTKQNADPNLWNMVKGGIL